MRALRLIAATSLALVVSACSRQSPTTPDTVAPDHARWNGMGYGSGNRQGADSTTVATSDEATTGDAALAPGMGYGSGN